MEPMWTKRTNWDHHHSIPLFHKVKTLHFMIFLRKLLCWIVIQPEYKIDFVFDFISGKFEVTKMLLEYGADINSQNGMGYTALHWSVGAGKITYIFLACGVCLCNMYASFFIRPRKNHSMAYWKGSWFESERWEGAYSTWSSCRLWYVQQTDLRIMRGKNWRNDFFRASKNGSLFGCSEWEKEHNMMSTSRFTRFYDYEFKTAQQRIDLFWIKTNLN